MSVQVIPRGVLDEQGVTSLSARMDGTTGRALVGFVSRDGAVSDLRVVMSSGVGQLTMPSSRRCATPRARPRHMGLKAKACPSSYGTTLRSTRGRPRVRKNRTLACPSRFPTGGIERCVASSARTTLAMGPKWPSPIFKILPASTLNMETMPASPATYSRCGPGSYASTPGSNGRRIILSQVRHGEPGAKDTTTPHS